MSGKMVFLVLVISIIVLVSTSPIKEKEIDDIIFRLAEMKTEMHLDGGFYFLFSFHFLSSDLIYFLLFPLISYFKARDLDELGGGFLLKKKSLDPLGGGHLVRSLDSLGGGHLVRNLDSLGGGHLIRDLND